VLGSAPCPKWASFVTAPSGLLFLSIVAFLFVVALVAFCFVLPQVGFPFTDGAGPPYWPFTDRILDFDPLSELELELELDFYS
jgi:hypothetical protein